MNIKLTTLSLLLTFFLSACGNSTDPWVMKPLSDFSIQQDALENRANLKLIYCSRGPIMKHNDYYYQYVVVDKETKDTIRILCPNSTVTEENFNDDNWEYISVNSTNSIDKMVLRNTFNGVVPEDELNKDAEIKMDKYTKVASDPKFEYVENKNYPTVIGVVVRTESPNN